MVPLCTFPNSAGKICGSPALRGRDHCHFHNPARPVSGPRRPTTRPAYRWYSLYRSLQNMPPEQAIPTWNHVVQAALKHEISQESVFKIMKRYAARVNELGATMRHPVPKANRNPSASSQNPPIQRIAPATPEIANKHRQVI